MGHMGMISHANLIYMMRFWIFEHRYLDEILGLSWCCNRLRLLGMWEWKECILHVRHVNFGGVKGQTGRLKNGILKSIHIFHILIPETCECYLIWKKKKKGKRGIFEDMIKLSVLSGGIILDYEWAVSAITCLYKARKKERWQTHTRRRCADLKMLTLRVK